MDRNRSIWFIGSVIFIQALEYIVLRIAQKYFLYLATWHNELIIPIEAVAFVGVGILALMTHFSDKFAVPYSAVVRIPVGIAAIVTEGILFIPSLLNLLQYAVRVAQVSNNMSLAPLMIGILLATNFLAAIVITTKFVAECGISEENLRRRLAEAAK